MALGCARANAVSVSPRDDRKLMCFVMLAVPRLENYTQALRYDTSAWAWRKRQTRIPKENITTYANWLQHANYELNKTGMYKRV